MQIKDLGEFGVIDLLTRMVVDQRAGPGRLGTFWKSLIRVVGVTLLVVRHIGSLRCLALLCLVLVRSALVRLALARLAPARLATRRMTSPLPSPQKRFF